MYLKIRHGETEGWVVKFALSKEPLKKINKIVHPFVYKDFLEWKKKFFFKYVVFESALIFESGSYKKNDYNILLTSDLNERIKRVVKRDT